MVWETAIATALGDAAGSAVGSGISSLFGGGSDGIDVSENARLTRSQARIAQQMAGPNMRAQVDAAKSAGLHPLYALGFKGLQSSPVIAGGSGQAASGSHIKLDPLAGQQRELLAAQVERTKAETAEIRNRTMQSGLDTIQRFSTASAVGLAQQKALQEGPIPLFIKVVDRDGNIKDFPNPDLGIELPESIGAGFLVKSQMPPNKTRTPTGPRPNSGRPRHRLQR